MAAIDCEESVVRAARLICLILFAPTVLLTALLHNTLFVSFSGEAALVADMVLLLSPLAVFWMVDVSVLVVRSDYLGVMLVFLIQPFVMVAGIIALWSVGLISTATVLAVYGCSTVVTAIFSFFRLRISVRGPRLRAMSVFTESKVYAGSSVAEAGLRRIDQILMLPLLGSVSVGIYSVAASVVTAPLSLSQALAASYFGSIANAVRRGQRTLVGEAVRSSWILGIMSSAAVATLAPLFVTFIFGPEFSEAAVLCLWMAPVVALGVVASVQTGILNAMGRGRVMFLGHATALVVVCGGFTLLLHLWGMVAAIAVVVVANLVLVIVTAAGLGIGVGRMIPRGNDINRTLKIFFGRF